MDDTISPPNNMFDESMLDFDYMDQLLSDECNLHAKHGSEFININSNIPAFDPLFLWPNNDHTPEDVQEEREKSLIFKNISVSDSQTKDGILTKAHVNNSVGFHSLSESFQESSPTSRRWWLPPSVKERLGYVIQNIKHSTLHQNALIQIWLPENREGNKVLSTHDHLFSLGSSCPQLSKFRNISESYRFAAEGDSKDLVGLPGRVFMGKVPEWTPDVRLFNSMEYPRVVDAQQCDVRGSVAVPIFDLDRQSCLGVLEVILTTRKSNYMPEIEDLSKALEVTDGLYQAALPEILKLLKSTCQTHNLPLAQTWIPCIQQRKDGCRHSDANLIHCISTMDPACYVHDSHYKDFQEACSEHHLLKGQGVVGRAFNTNQPCYSSDVTSMTKTEYPLSHHARVFGLCGVVAVRFRSTLTGNVDYVLEFFLPVDCKDQKKQMSLLNSLSSVIEKSCQSLRVVTDNELREEDYSVVTDSVEEVLEVEEILTEKPVDLIREQQNDLGSADGTLINDGIKLSQKRRGGAKTEKTITLEMLRQYFAGSLKDAAKNLGVCQTTLKRICRQQGIQRWPSRKIKKVGHSLEKIQRVMDSVHGASGSFQIKSLYSNFPNLASLEPTTSSFPPSKIHIVDSEVTECVMKSLATSCSQTSSSSQSCSSDNQPSLHPRTPTGEDASNNPLKRAQSDAELHVSLYSEDQDQDQEKEQEPNVCQRSHSHKLLAELPTTPTLPTKGGNARDEYIPRVKVTYGDEKIRFRLQEEWGHDQILEEIAKRFRINDINCFHLKYFDDDSEWVLLTCDADLEECIDVYRSLKGGTVQLALFEQQHMSGSLGSSVIL